MKLNNHLGPAIRPLIIGMLGLLITGRAFAQFQVSQPGEEGPNGPSSNPNAVNSPTRQPGVELYGNNNRDKTPRYSPQTEYLPSEILIATQRSGATPSELRTQADRVGPLSPNGSADYVPLISPMQRIYGSSPGNVFGPAWLNPPTQSYRGNAPLPMLNVSDAQNAAPHRQGNPDNADRSPLNVTPAPLSPLQPLNNQPIVRQPLGQATRVDSTESHPLTRTRPGSAHPASTQPSTRPSLADPLSPFGE